MYPCSQLIFELRCPLKCCGAGAGARCRKRRLGITRIVSNALSATHPLGCRSRLAITAERAREQGIAPFGGRNGKHLDVVIMATCGRRLYRGHLRRAVVEYPSHSTRRSKKWHLPRASSPGFAVH